MKQFNILNEDWLDLDRRAHNKNVVIMTSAEMRWILVRKVILWLRTEFEIWGSGTQMNFFFKS